MRKNRGQSPIQYVTVILVIVALAGSWMAYSSAGGVPGDVARKEDLTDLKEDLNKDISSIEERLTTISEEIGIPAMITVSVASPTVKVGETTTLLATATNVGGKEGSKTLTLKIAGETVDTREVTLGPGDSTPLEFTTSPFDEIGDYNISIGGAIGTLTVMAAEEVTLTVTNRRGWKCSEPMFARLSEFEAATGIDVKVMDISPDDMTKKTLAEFTAGSRAFDVVMATVEKDFMAYKDYVMSLDEFIKEEFGSIDAYKSKISPKAFESSKWDGHVKFVPFHGNTRFLIYRKELFNDPEEKEAFKNEYGYELKPPETYEELIDVAKFFTRPEEGLYGYATGLRDKYPQHWLEHHFLADGINVIDLETNTCDFASGAKREKAIETAQTLHDLVYKYEAIPNSCMGLGHAAMMEEIKTGKYAMAEDWWGDHWPVLNSKEIEDVNGEFGSAIAPHNKNCRESTKGGSMSIWTVGINKRCDHPEAAWKFVKWFTSKEILQEEAKGSGSGSHWVEVDSASAEKGWLSEGMSEAMAHSTPNKEGLCQLGPSVYEAFKTEASEMMTDPSPDAPEKMVDDLAKKINDILKPLRE